MPRPRKPIPSEWPSMSAAAAGMGIPLDILKLAKRCGSDAFRASGRVDGDKLKVWMRDNADRIKELSQGGIKDKKVFEEWRKLKILNDARERTLIPRSEVIQAIFRCGERIRALLAQKLRNEYPAAVAGMDVAQARIFGLRLESSVLEEWGKLEAVWQ